MCRGKEQVFVLDFVNNTSDIEEAFQPYYTTTVLSEETDPNILHDLQRDILNFKLFSEAEIDSFVGDYMRDVRPDILNSFLDEMVARFCDYLSDEQLDFKDKAKNYVRKYAFISQILSFDDTSLEKLYIFLRMLVKKLPIDREPLPLEMLQSINMESYKIVKSKSSKIELTDDEGIIEPIQGKGRGIDLDDEDVLSQIIKDVNDKFGTNFTPDDEFHSR